MRSTQAGVAEIRHVTSTANACTIDTDCKINIVLKSDFCSQPGDQVVDFHRPATACRAARDINGSLLHRLCVSAPLTWFRASINGLKYPIGALPNVTGQYRCRMARHRRARHGKQRE
ncbi:hypothetical protein [Burkholderia sp. BCC0322]|uniref:hypothetical protein n=1 Tax=unclassified Burkholderia TaxID=2613784 RepID=UPI00158DDB10|nr:hypothetical protein [Burkholderia sp. BCC0322]